MQNSTSQADYNSQIDAPKPIETTSAPITPNPMLAAGLNWVIVENEIKSGNIDSIAAVNRNIENWEQNLKLLFASPKLLAACQNALKDVQKLNQQLIKEGKHGYTLMENELNDAINLALGSS
jgi:hypothetical protein